MSAGSKRRDDEMNRRPAKKTSKPGHERADASVSVPAALRPLVAALSDEPGVTVEKGWGSSNVVLKRRGKIFVILVGDGVVLKLPKNRVDELVSSPARKRKRSITPGVTRREHGWHF